MSSTSPATPSSDAAGPADQRSRVDVGGAGVEPGRTTVADVVVQKQPAIDLNIVVEYGVPIATLTQAIRLNVTGAVEQMTGLEVVEINIHVSDVYLPDDGDDPADAATDAFDDPPTPGWSGRRPSRR